MLRAELQLTIEVRAYCSVSPSWKRGWEQAALLHSGSASFIKLHFFYSKAFTYLHVLYYCNNVNLFLKWGLEEWCCIMVLIVCCSLSWNAFLSCLCTADPNFYSKNLLYLGKTYLKLNNKKMALLWLSKAKDYPAHTEEDKQVGS